MNHSPWIAQLRRTRPMEPLEENLDTDVVIVGGGIAGVSTAYFLMTQTNKNVVLLEANKIAHGATGHNAGQISSYYEMSLKDMIKKFGEVRSRSAQNIIEEDARRLFQGIFSHTKLTIPHSEFIGYEGCVTKEHIMDYLEDLYLRAQLGLKIRPILIAKEWLEENNLPNKHIPFFVATAQKNILQLLETDNYIYIGATPFLSGCVNSAVFTEELTGYLLSRYSNRFLLKEGTLVSKIILNKDDVVIHAGLNTVTGADVVLCTNGFESLDIVNQHGKDIDKFFHHEVYGLIGYMSGYKEQLTKPPFAASYARADMSVHELYTYVTRRPYEDETNAKHNLICVGGPESYLPDRATYDAKKQYPLEVADSIDTFTMQTYKHTKPMDYQWHGLMGYTKSGVRLIGREVKNPRLLYNLGCNGVGILTSVYGASRIAKIINNEIIEQTIFDPQ